MLDTALIVVDVQKGLFDKGTPVYKSVELLENINMLIGCFSAKKSPIVFMQHTNKTMLAEGSEDWQLHPGLDQPEGSIRLKKHHGSSFKDTELKEELDKLGVRKLVICGLVSHGCVKDACIDGKRLGYEVILSSDGHSSFNKKAAEIIDEWNGKLEAEGILIKTAQEIINSY